MNGLEVNWSSKRHGYTMFSEMTSTPLDGKIVEFFFMIDADGTLFVKGVTPPYKVAASFHNTCYFCVLGLFDINQNSLSIVGGMCQLLMKQKLVCCCSA